MGVVGDSLERALAGIVAKNNDLARNHAADRFERNPRPLDDLAWSHALEAAYPQIRAEWDAFVASGGIVPRIEDLIDEHQGNDGPWRAGLMVSKGLPATNLATRFPATVAATLQVPGIWSALWSVLEPGSELPEHHGPNAGMLRYHLGIDCGADAALCVDGVVTPYVDGAGILFDDTAAHAAWNRGDEPRVTLFLEVLRPINGPARWVNHAVQRGLALDPRYRKAPGRADEWDRALNGGRQRDHDASG